MSKSQDLLSYIREGRTMTQREKLNLIVQLSIPSILAQLSATVMFFIDASMVGHLGAKASASIGIVESTGWLMGGLASAVNMGFSVQVAHFIGANDFEGARRVLRQSLICSLVWSRRLTLFRHHRPLWHLLPDGRSGWLDAQVLGQHESAVDAQHWHVCDGRRLQLPLYIYP